MKNKAYKAIMSDGANIQIDADEVQEIIEARASGEDYMARQGFINTSFLVSIVRDGDRMGQFYDDKSYAEGERLKRMKKRGPEKLDNIFDDVEALDQVTGSDDTKRIGVE